MLNINARVSLLGLGTAIAFSVVASVAQAETKTFKLNNINQSLDISNIENQDFNELAQANETSAERAARLRAERRAERERKRAERAAKRRQRSTRPRFGSFN